MFPCSGASLFVTRAPEALTSIPKNCRTAFIDGPVSTPFAKVPDIPVDMVRVDWQLVAERIVDDFMTKKNLDTASPTVFEAEAHLQVPLSAFAQSI